MKPITTHRLLNITLALSIALALAYVWPDDEASMQVVISEQGEAFRLARAARDICGQRAAWLLIDSHAIQCVKEKP